MPKIVLVVEDDIKLLSILEKKLTFEGFKVLLAENGEEGLKRALDHKPDFIILDLVMPVMDGITMLKKLRAEEQGTKTPVLILTNQSDSQDIEEALKLDAVNYFLKTDCSLEDLIKKIIERIPHG